MRAAPIAIFAAFLFLPGCLYFGPSQPIQSGEKTYYGTNNCLFRDPGLDCGATRAYYENGRTYLDLSLINRFGKPITISGASCVLYGDTANALAHAYQMEAGLVSGRDYKNGRLQCVDSQGNPAPAYPEFRGSLIIWFNYDDDLDRSIRHVAVASMLSS